MDIIYHQLFALFPALAFLLTGVPLAILLDKLGFFRAAADILLHRNPSTLKLWILAAATTAILNLDTTIVLLTPLYIHIAKRAKIDPLPLVVIPLLLASFASSLLPVSNLTNLIAASALHISVAEFITHLGLPTLMAVIVGWFFYKRKFPDQLTVVPLDKEPDHRALTIGGAIIFGLLVGFTLGPLIGLEAWMVALIADIILVFITRSFPWRSLPLTTALGVAVVASLAVIIIPPNIFNGLLESPNIFLQIVGSSALATLGASTINNLPTVLIGVNNSTSATWGLWAWLIGVNVGAVLLPVGALANLLWKTIAEQNNIPISFRRYISITFPIGLPTLFVALLVLVLERLLVTFL